MPKFQLFKATLNIFFNDLFTRQIVALWTPFVNGLAISSNVSPSMALLSHPANYGRYSPPRLQHFRKVMRVPLVDEGMSTSARYHETNS